MNDKHGKSKAVETFLAREQIGGNAQEHTLNRLFPRELPADELPDFESVRAKILQRKVDKSAGKALLFRGRFALYAVAAAALVVLGMFFFQRKVDAPGQTAQPLARQKTMQPESYHKSVDVFYRHASSVTASLQGKQLSVKATDLTALFSFEPNEAVTGVTIETRHGSVSVIGTKFIVDSTPAGLFVAVQTGKVRVGTQGEYHLLSAGQELRMTAKTQHTVVADSPGETARLFTKIQSAKADWPENISSQAKQSIREKSVLPITITLENGTTIKGFLELEDEVSIQVRVTAMGQKILTFRKSEIIERR